MSLFLRLYKYRQRTSRSSQENFFTEAFAGVLQASPELGVCFVNRFVNRLIDPYKVDRIHIDTQKSDSGDRPDIWIEVRSDSNGYPHVIAMENKIVDRVKNDQLHAYMKLLERKANAKSRTLACVTCHESASVDTSTCDREVSFKHIYWHKVAHWLKERLLQQQDRSHTQDGYLVPELLALMEEWKMTMHLTAGDLTAATNYKRFIENVLINLLEEVSSECKFSVSRVKGTSRSLYLYRSSSDFPTNGAI